MLHTKFRGNRTTGTKEEDFLEGFYHIYECDHFGHVTSIITTNFHFLVPESLHIKFGSKRPIVFEKSGF